MADMDLIVSLVIVVSALLGIVYALINWKAVASISLEKDGEAHGLVSGDITSESMDRLNTIYHHIQDGAKAFLFAQYRTCAIFVVFFSIIVLVLTSRKRGGGWDWTVGTYTMVAYILGAFTSMFSGYIGMSVAVFSNARTTIAATRGWDASFKTALKAGIVAGFMLVSVGVLALFGFIRVIATQYDFTDETRTNTERLKLARQLFEIVAGYGLGGSTIALFGRVGGGIYTKAADVGADLAGKVISGLPEDDPRNPATIADNVGDNVGDVAGMGADLFGSFAESTCAALLVGATSMEMISEGWGSILYPLVITATGIIVSLVTALVGIHLQTVSKEKDIELVLKVQLGLSALLMTLATLGTAYAFLPGTFKVGEGENLYEMHPVDAFVCVACGLAGGCLIGFITEYFTSHSYHPVREVAEACSTGAATNIIYGLSLGYKSAVIPIWLIAIAVYVSFYLGGMYGVALAALGMLGTLCTSLAIDVYGPVCDNAGGIAEMADFPAEIRDKTDALDAAGNTTAAIGKGFAIGSAALVSLALFGAFITRIGQSTVNVLQPISFAALFIGAMLPYWFTAMTMKSVGIAAMKMVIEVKRQFDTIPGLLEGQPGVEPDHARCIKISTDASLHEMLPPGVLVIFAPILTGIFFGVDAVAGLLVGALTSGVQLAISQSNSGGAWDNAKKYIEKGSLSIELGGEMRVQGKGSDVHKAAVVGDTVGDPLKDTSGPALNILMKLMAIISLVFADFFMGINEGRGLLKV